MRGSFFLYQASRNGQYTERGSKQIDGYMSERWWIEAEYAIKIVIQFASF
jgi:glucose 1-dehydrogenase